MVVYCVDRIGQLMELMGTLQSHQGDSGWSSDHDSFRGVSASSLTMYAGETAFDLKSVTYGPPKSSSVLCRDLSLQLRSGTNVLVTGDSGCGKTSLLRVIAGLWTPSSGRVERLAKQGPSGLIYLPQKPYMTSGTLRDQILFPFTEADVVPDDERMHQYLTVAGLNHLVDRLGGLDVNKDWNWSDELSPGEMQRLSFVRLFFHKPQFAMLDEATSQVSEEMEATLYLTCRHLHITLMSIGHRRTIRAYHPLTLHIHGSAAWTLADTASFDTGTGGAQGGGGGGGGSDGGGGGDSQGVGGKMEEAGDVEKGDSGVPLTGSRVSD
ncbi:hypothetical protein ACOMHN_063175 [Nucella lapillus]